MPIEWEGRKIVSRNLIHELRFLLILSLIPVYMLGCIIVTVTPEKPPEIPVEGKYTPPPPASPTPEKPPPPLPTPKNDQPAAINGILMTAGGGALADPNVQTALYSAIDWGSLVGSISNAYLEFIVYVDGVAIDPLSDLEYDIEYAKMLLAEAGYVDGIGLVTLLYPEEDSQIFDAAVLVADSLQKIAVRVQVEAVPGNILEGTFQNRIESDEETIALIR
jgi:ABC-type transport system substrate-binding protein